MEDRHHVIMFGCSECDKLKPAEHVYTYSMHVQRTTVEREREREREREKRRNWMGMMAAQPRPVAGSLNIAKCSPEPM
jgi:hypothetical protein